MKIDKDKKIKLLQEQIRIIEASISNQIRTAVKACKDKNIELNKTITDLEDSIPNQIKEAVEACEKKNIELEKRIKTLESYKIKVKALNDTIEEQKDSHLKLGQQYRNLSSKKKDFENRYNLCLDFILNLNNKNVKDFLNRFVEANNG